MTAAIVAVAILYAAFWLAADHHRHSQFDDMFWRQAGGLWLDPCSGEVTYGNGRPFGSQSGSGVLLAQEVGAARLREQHEKNRLARRGHEAIADMGGSGEYPTP